MSRTALCDCLAHFLDPVAASSVVIREGAGVIAEQERAFTETAADLRRRLEEGAVERGVPITFVVAAGDPFHELRRVADEVRADAVVVGASTSAGHRFVGSLAVRLVKAGRWPVTVVP